VGVRRCVTVRKLQIPECFSKDETCVCTWPQASARGRRLLHVAAGVCTWPQASARGRRRPHVAAVHCYRVQSAVMLPRSYASVCSSQLSSAPGVPNNSKLLPTTTRPAQTCTKPAVCQYVLCTHFSRMFLKVETFPDQCICIFTSLCSYTSSK
jgi:hypothetical protein